LIGLSGGDLKCGTAVTGEASIRFVSRILYLMIVMSMLKLGAVPDPGVTVMVTVEVPTGVT